MQRRRLILALPAALVLFSSARFARAQAVYPSKPVKIVENISGGGGVSDLKGLIEFAKKTPATSRSRSARTWSSRRTWGS